MTSGTQSVTVPPNGQTLNLTAPAGGTVTVSSNGFGQPFNGATIPSTGWLWTITGQAQGTTQSLTRSFAPSSTPYDISLVVTDSRGAPSIAATGKVMVTPQSTSMKEVRDGHAAIFIPSINKVLVTGGQDSNATASSTAELYDPQTGLWRYTTFPMTEAHVGHTASMLPNGKVLIAGGSRGSSNGSGAEIFDPATETFTSAAPLLTGRALHKAIELVDGSGRVVIVGGCSTPGCNPILPAEIFDINQGTPGKGQWTQTQNAPNAHVYFPALLLNNGKILLPAGSSSVDLYDPQVNSWQQMAPLVSAPNRSTHAAVTLTDSSSKQNPLLNGKVLIVGGNDGFTNVQTPELYDPSVLPNGQSTTLSVPPGIRFAGWYPTATRLLNGDVLMVGGVNLADVPVTFTTDIYLFNYSTSSWSKVGTLAGGRANHTATLLPSGRVLITGGTNGQALSSAEIF